MEEGAEAMKDKLLSWTNRIVSILLVCLGIFVLLYSRSKLEFGSVSNPRGGFTPIIFSTALIILGGINTAIEFAKKPEIPAKIRNIHWAKWAIYMAECALYVFLIDKVGYFIDTAIILFAMIKLSGAKGWIKPLLITLITAFLLFAMFNYAMKIVLPKANWF